MSYGVVQAEKMTTESGYSLGAGNASSFKNRLINGSMTIDQRNAGASVAVTDSSYAVDRFVNRTSQNGKLTAQQTPSATETGYATRVAAGFSNYLAFTSLSAYSPVSGDYIGVCQNIEGFNFADMGWGTASAKTVTLSFWAYSSLTGQMGGAFRNSAQNRSYPFAYTINSANTWEYKTITIPGDTTGTWVGATNGIGVQVWFNLGTGSSSTGTANTWAAAGYINSTGSTAIVGTNGATFYLTGVQLEVGTVATSFDFRSYGTELALCQRYFQSWGGETQYTCFAQGTSMSSGTQIICNMIPIVQMRVGPSFSSTGQFGVVYTGNVVNATTSTLVSNQTTSNGFSFLMNSLSGSLPSTGYAVSIATTELTSRFRLSSEL